MMDRMPALRAIVCYGTGYDGVDLAAAAQRRIAVGTVRPPMRPRLPISRSR